MQIFATFESTVFLEMAISELEEKGIGSIYAIPLDLRKGQARLMDSLHRADGISLVDKGMILAFVFATIGTSKGFVWAWGPVIWGLIGAASGFTIGVLIDLAVYFAMRRKHRRNIRKGKKGEVILIVTCSEALSDTVTDVLWDHMALGMAKTK